MRKKYREGKLKKECKVCVKEFFARHDRQGLFCSLKCQRIGRKKKEKSFKYFLCKVCGKECKRRIGANGTYEYCSIPCMAIARGRKLSQQNHPNWKGGTSKRAHQIRKIIKQALLINGSCRRCGSQSDLQGHHIIPLSKDRSLAEELTNIKVLCAKCHAEEHPDLRGMISRPRQRFGLYKKCVICYKEFYTPKYKENTAKYCSKKCQLEGLHGKRSLDK